MEFTEVRSRTHTSIVTGPDGGAETDGSSDTDGPTETDGVNDGEMVTEGATDTDGANEGAIETEGDVDGKFDGATDGEIVVEGDVDGSVEVEGFMLFTSSLPIPSIPIPAKSMYNCGGWLLSLLKNRSPPLGCSAPRLAIMIKNLSLSCW